MAINNRYIARKLNQETKLGAVLDAIFDRVFVILIFGFFFFQLNLPYYFILLFFTRDIFTTLFPIFYFIFSLQGKVEIKSRLIGKINTSIQFIVLVIFIAGLSELAKIGIYVVFIVGVLAIIDYALYLRRGLKKK